MRELQKGKLAIAAMNLPRSTCSGAGEFRRLIPPSRSRCGVSWESHSRRCAQAQRELGVLSFDPQDRTAIGGGLSDELYLLFAASAGHGG